MYYKGYVPQPVYIGELLVIIQNWKQPRYPTSRTDMYILKYSLDGILQSKKTEVLLCIKYFGWTFLIQRINKINLMQKEAVLYVIPFILMPEIGKTILWS